MWKAVTLLEHHRGITGEFTLSIQVQPFCLWHLHISIRWRGIKRKAIAFPPLKHTVRSAAQRDAYGNPICGDAEGAQRYRRPALPCRTFFFFFFPAPTHDHQALAVRLALMEDAARVGTARGLSASCTSRPTAFQTPRRRRWGRRGSHLIRCPDGYMLISSVRGGKKMMICHDSRHSLRHWHASVLVGEPVVNHLLRH